MKIYSDDGREFKTIAECNAYESELALKKKKEELDKKIQEEKKKELVQYRITKLKEINEDLAVLVDKIKEYEKETRYKIIYVYDYSNGKTIAQDTLNNSIDFAWDNLCNDISKIVCRK